VGRSEFENHDAMNKSTMVMTVEWRQHVDESNDLIT
jgi:hypothetical protein